MDYQGEDGMVKQVQGHCNINLLEIETTQKGAKMGTFDVTSLGNNDSRRDLEGALGDFCVRRKSC